jgi:chloramphenicol 3-O phosphotransferase
MDQGNIILLNGTSSAGKSTIAQALQEVLETPYLHSGIDHFLERLPKRIVTYSDGNETADAEGWLAVFHDDVVTEVRIRPMGYRWIAGMYRAIAALAEVGLDVIVDDVIYDSRVLQSAVEILPTQQVFFVGVRCPLEVAEHREQTRGNRPAGGARFFNTLVHTHGAYDLEVDSARFSPTECAMQIKHGLQDRRVPNTFSQLRTGLHSAQSARVMHDEALLGANSSL